MAILEKEKRIVLFPQREEKRRKEKKEGNTSKDMIRIVAREIVFNPSL